MDDELQISLTTQLTQEIRVSTTYIPLEEILRLLNKHNTQVSSSSVENSFVTMANDIGIKYVDFTQPWDHSDIKLIVEDKPIYVNKMILLMWSPVFKAMFNHDFKEKNAEEIKLPGKKYADVLELAMVTHPPNKEITNDNVIQLLSLLQEYQIDALIERAEEVLCNQSSSVRLFVLSKKFNLTRLHESMLGYLKRAPMSRLKTQSEFEQLDQSFLIELLAEKLEKFESSIDSLREVRMVLERKKPTTFPGMHLLCNACTGAREQQVDCNGCMKSCCQKLSIILRDMEA